MAPHFPIGIYAIPEISMVGAPEHDLTGEEGPVRDGHGALPGDRARPDPRRRRAACSRCCSTARTAACSASTASAPAPPSWCTSGQAVLGLGGGLDYFLQTVFNYPTLAECYKVAALDASNKLRY